MSRPSIKTAIVVFVSLLALYGASAGVSIEPVAAGKMFPLEWLPN
jgi:hypothetical protein